MRHRHTAQDQRPTRQRAAPIASPVAARRSSHTSSIIVPDASSRPPLWRNNALRWRKIWARARRLSSWRGRPRNDRIVEEVAPLLGGTFDHGQIIGSERRDPRRRGQIGGTLQPLPIHLHTRAAHREESPLRRAALAPCWILVRVRPPDRPRVAPTRSFPHRGRTARRSGSRSPRAGWFCQCRSRRRCRSDRPARTGRVRCNYGSCSTTAVGVSPTLGPKSTQGTRTGIKRYKK